MQAAAGRSRQRPIPAIGRHCDEIAVLVAFDRTPFAGAATPLHRAQHWLTSAHPDILNVQNEYRCLISNLFCLRPLVVRRPGDNPHGRENARLSSHFNPEISDPESGGFGGFDSLFSITADDTNFKFAVPHSQERPYEMKRTLA